MEQQRIKTVTVVGEAVPKEWGQAYVETTTFGQVIIVMTLWCAGEGDLIDLAEIGGSILSNLRESTTLDSEIVGGLGEDLTLSVVMVTRREDGLMVSGLGEGEVYLLREGKLGKIFEGGEEIKTVNGEILAGDTLLVVTKELRQKIEGEKMKTIMEGGVAGVDELAVLVRGSQESSRMVAVLGKVEGEEIVVQEQKEVLQGENKSWKESLQRFREKITLKKPLKIRQEKKTNNFWVGVIILGLLIVGIGGGVVKRSRLVKEKAYTDLVASVGQKIEEARSVGDLNPARAKDLLVQARAEKDSYVKNTDDQEYQMKASELGTQIDKTEVEVFHKQQVEVKTFVELSVISQDLRTEAMILDEKRNLFFPDLSTERVLGMNVGDKSVTKTGLGGVGKMREISEYSGKIYGLVEGGVAVVTGGEEDAKIVIEPDDLWGEITQIGMYGGNVYLLDKQQGEIWKYPVLSEGFGTRKRWLAIGIAPDLSGVVSMKVEGDIWILTESGKLLRYSRGAPVSFSMEGFPAEQTDKLVDPKALFVTENEIYVLEAGAKRVVVFGIEGKYERQYGNDVFGEGKDLVIEGEKGYVLMSDKIVWFAL